MNGLKRCTTGLCKTCKYRTYFSGGIGYKARISGTTETIACNYMIITDHSRIFEDGKPQYDPKYCDKYEKGKPVRIRDKEESKT